MATRDDPDWEFKERDVLVLRELSRDPQLSSRDLARILEEKYGIDVSHVTVSESIRGMREEGVFREAIIPNEEYFHFALFEFKFNPKHFEAEAAAFVEQIATGPTVALRTSKKLIDQGLGQSLRDAQDDEAAAQAAVFETHDHEEGATAFMEGRDPEFEGR